MVGQMGSNRNTLGEGHRQSLGWWRTMCRSVGSLGHRIAKILLLIGP